MKKICKKCKTPKDEKDFRPGQLICIPCDNEIKKEHSKKKREEARMYLGY